MSHSPVTGIGRRLALAAVAALACTAGATTAHADRLAEGGVDVSLESTNSSIAPGKSGEQSFTVTNNGAAATPVELTLKIVTPFFVNAVDGQLPDGCHFLLSNPDRDVPYIIDCRINSGLAPQASTVIKIPLTVVDSAPTVFLIGRAIVTPVPGSTVQDNVITNNVTPYGVQVIADQPTTPAGPADLYVSWDAPHLTPSTDQSTVLRAGNLGKPTTGAARLVYVTPFFVNLTANLPTGCERLIANDDPTVPQVLACTIPVGLSTEQVAFKVPLTLVPGGPVGACLGAVIVTRAPDNDTDIDADLRDNFGITTVMAGAT